MLSGCGKVAKKCAKHADKVGEKYLKSPCIKAVQKSEWWNTKNDFSKILLKRGRFTRVFHFSLHKFYTAEMQDSKVLRVGFPPFPHSLLHTATTLYIRENGF